MYRPNGEGEKWTHPVLRPGMQGHDRPLVFENPVLKPWMKSEVVPLELAHNKDTPGGGSSLVSGPAWQSEFDRLLTIDPQAAYKHVQKDIAGLEAAGTRAQVVADLLYPRGPSPVFAGQNPAVGALIEDMFKPFDIVKGKGGSPGQPYGGDQPTPKAMKNGLNEKIANLVTALRSNG